MSSGVVAVAGGLTPVAGTPPFTVYMPGQSLKDWANPPVGVGRDFSPEFAQIRVQFTVRMGRVTRPFDATFTAQNAKRDTTPTNDCSYGRPTT